MNIYNSENVIEPTRVTEQSATLIEPMLKSNNIHNVESGIILEVEFSIIVKHFNILTLTIPV